MYMNLHILIDPVANGIKQHFKVTLYAIDIYPTSRVLTIAQYIIRLCNLLKSQVSSRFLVLVWVKFQRQPTVAANRSLEKS